MRILTSNFQMALRIAIEEELKLVRKSGLETNGFIEGLREVLEASRRGEQITVSDR
jgi:hypothetical protein